MELLGKSSGISLLDHSLLVKELSLSLLSYSVQDRVYRKYSGLMGDISLLHDIGKGTISFQGFLLGDKGLKVKFRHNEIGWAFLSKYLSDDYVGKELLLSSVYWHHGISNKLHEFSVDSILGEVDSVSITNMLGYLISVVGEENINEVEEFDISTTKSPFYYSSDNIKDLPLLHLLRSILITSDRLVSVDDYVYSEEIVKGYFNLSDTFNIKCSYSGERYDNQVKIIEDIGKTTILKAPAGFGKTLVGLQWGIQQGKRILWVTPRNTIAESVYHSLEEESKALGIRPTIQLILGGEVKRGHEGLYNSDIIVTNIDNYLSPSFNNSLLVNSSLINGATVVFDEFHELVTDAPLMGVFITLMRLRNSLSNSKTLLLSATPTSINNLWDKPGVETLLLPNKSAHYSTKLINDKKYKLTVVESNVSIKKDSNTLVIKNSIKNSQVTMNNGDYVKLLHSNFSDERRSEDLGFLIKNYGKHSEVSEDKPNIVGTHILQASLDVSFRHLVEDVLSPESTLQRLGRCNRWGEYSSGSITIYKSSKGSSGYVGDNTVKRILYNRNLSDEWFDYILQYNGQELSLDEFYVIYNSFTQQYLKEINQYIKDLYLKSVSDINQIYPKKISIKDKDSDKVIIKAGGNKLRSSKNNNEIFFVALDYNTREWVGPFNVDLFQPFDLRFDEGGGIINKMVNSMKVLRRTNDERFDYNDMLNNKKLSIDEIRRNASYNNTPYFNYVDVYDNELGLINENFLNSIK